MIPHVVKVYLCFFFFLNVINVNAQKNKSGTFLSDTHLEKENVTSNETKKPLSNKNQTDMLAAWLKSPYLNVPVEKATVGELTAAFNYWLKEHPEEMKMDNRHKDDDVVKFQRQLYRWQIGNDIDEVPATEHKRLDAFVQYEAQSQHETAQDFTNPDGNWKLIGPTYDPIEVPYSEPSYSTEKSANNSGLGRINCIEFSNWDTRNIWVGTSTGGVWKTWDSGQNWTNITMNLPIMEISDIAIDQTNSNIVYVAVGDRDGQGGWYGNGVGSGLYKTTDGGTTWTAITANFGTGTYIMNLWVHPKRPWEVVVVKANGIYKSMDSGNTWAQVLKTDYVAPYTATNDLFFQGAAYADLANPERIYSSYFKRYSASDFSFQLRRSDDFGSTWQMMDSVKSVLNDPTFSANYTRLAVAPSDANCLYILSSEYDFDLNSDRFGAVVRTLDGGHTWENRGRYPSVPNTLGWVLGDSTDIGSQSFYDLVLAIDPKNKNKIYTGGVDGWASLDGGMSFNKTTFWLSALGNSAHADHHWGEYQPISGDFFLATDGGLYKTKNLTPGNNTFIAKCYSDTAYNYFSQNCYQFPTKWEYMGNGISNNEFYAIAVSKSNPNIIMGGAQDNGTLIRRDGKWYSVFGGDGFVPMIHPTNPNIYYTTVYNGYTWRTTDGGNTYRFISTPMDTVDVGAWLTPMEMFEANPNIIIQGRNNNLWRTTDGGNKWKAISNFPNGKYANSTTAIAITPANSNIMYVARRTRESASVPTQYFLYKTIDGGATWTNIWNAAFPLTRLTDIAIHSTQPNKIWATFSAGFNAANPNQTKKVFYSADGGTTWTNISAGLPPVPVWTVAVQDDINADAIYVGTAVGVYYKDSTMAQFSEFQVGMPRGVEVTDLKIHTGVGKIFAGTYGRGMWGANLHNQPYDPAVLASARANRSMLLNVYPNPARDAIKIEWDASNEEGQSIDVVDLFGKIIFSQKAFNGKTVVDMSQNTSGIYTVQLKTGKEVIVKKFTIVK